MRFGILYLTFDKKTGKVMVSDNLQIEMITFGSAFFQNIDGPFQKKTNQQQQQVHDKYLVYSETW